MLTLGMQQKLSSSTSHSSSNMQLAVCYAKLINGRGEALSPAQHAGLSMPQAGAPCKLSGNAIYSYQETEWGPLWFCGLHTRLSIPNKLHGLVLTACRVHKEYLLPLAHCYNNNIYYDGVPRISTMTMPDRPKLLGAYSLKSQVAKLTDIILVDFRIQIGELTQHLWVTI